MLTRDRVFPELVFRIVVQVVVHEEERRQGLPVMRRPVVQAPGVLVAVHVDLGPI
jgi:hypothetical protein